MGAGRSPASSVRSRAASAARALASLLSLSVLATAGAGSPSPARNAGDEAVERFAAELLESVGAERRRCPDPVTEQVGLRNMRAICAAFDGDFERLARISADRFDRPPAASPEGPPAAPDASSIRPATPWERSGGAHERIFRVGDASVGVRHVPGVILVVW